MSDCTPTLQQLLKALKKLESWFMFGVMLGVPVSQLKKIKSNHQGDVDLCKIDMFQYWLDNTLLPTWDNVAATLEGMDQLVLAAQIKDTYLWTSLNTQAGASKELEAFPDDSSAFMDVISAPIPDLPLLSSSATTNDQSSDEIKAEIRADVTVVNNLKELEIAFGRMLVKVKRQLSKCDLSEALIFLGSVIGSEEFIGCDNFGKLMWQLQRDHHIGVFNISNLKNLVDNFERDESGALLDELTDAIEAYVEKKENFLKHTTVLEFQRAVVSRVKPLPTHGLAVVTIKIPKELASQQTLKDIENLAMEGFEECYKKFIRLHAEPGSVIISWIFPLELSSRLEQLASDNAAIFENNGVMEVKLGEKKVFPCTEQEGTSICMALQDVSEEDKSKLKQLYAVFHQHLIDAVSDSESLATQLHSASLLSQEEQAMLSSTLASDGAFSSKVEEEPHLLTVLMEKMTTVEQLQTLLEDMTAWLSGSRQEQKQLVTDNERLINDKADLISRLQLCEENLLKTNKSMMAVVQESNETISHLKSQLETKTHELNDVIKTNSELIEDAAHLLKDKDDKISSQEAQLLHLKDTISILQKKDSQTKQLGSERDTSAALLPASAAYSSQAHPGYSMSSGHHVSPSGSGSGASSEGYLSQKNPSATFQSAHMPSAPDAWLERPMLGHMPPAPDAWLEWQMGIQKSVTDSKKGSFEFSLDPFHPLLKTEFKCRAEDEFVQFIYKLLESVSNMNLPFKYENPITEQYDMSASEALHGPALDFRWQLKHLEYNRTLFCREVFKGRIGEPEFRRWTRNLREKADNLPAVDFSMEARDSLSDLLDEMVQFTETITQCIRDRNIPGLQIHLNTLKYIYKRYLLDHRQLL